MDAALREFVRERAEQRCEYCHAPQEFSGTQLVGATAIGRATVQLLAMNQPDRLRIRRRLLMTGWNLK